MISSRSSRIISSVFSKRCLQTQLSLMTQTRTVAKPASDVTIQKIHQSHNDEKLPSSRFSYRTHTCGELRRENAGEFTTLCGWVEFKRSNLFLVLRDSFGSTQILLTDFMDKDETLEKVTPESMLKVTGKVLRRPDGQNNSKMKTGEIEVVPDTIEMLNGCNFLPFRVQKFAGKGERIRQKYRYLDIRGENMQKNLRLRSKLLSEMRKVLEANSFIEVETPTLFRPTPGGAREFIVPSSYNPGKFYSLPQSPQQLKQLLMVGGIDRYYQLARCYRDEPFKTDRQAEFTQLDIEMSFVTPNDVMALSEEIIRSCWPREFSDDSFKILKFADTMEKYGSDKPDTRFGMELHDITTFIANTVIELLQRDKPIKIQAIKVNNAHIFTKKVCDTLKKSLKSAVSDPCQFTALSKVGENWSAVQGNKNLNPIMTDNLIDYLQLEDNELLFVSWGTLEKVQTTLGALRTLVSKTFDELSIPYRNFDSDQFLWVHDFPLFELDPETGSLCSVHHPFTAPHPDDIGLVDTDPLKARGQAYDLVLNGNEIAGGSVRVHDSKLQRKIFETLQIDPSSLKYLLEALDSGAPPHGGIAFGIDRILSILCRTETIRDVIAFPKNSNGEDLMTDSPSKISSDLINQFHITTKIDN